MEKQIKVRVDKWLWAVRVFKTRSLASTACKAGRVKIEGKSVKASRNIAIGEEIHVQKGQEKKVLKAVKLIEKRVGASLAVECYEDLSPKPSISPSQQRLDSVFYTPVAKRGKGEGRPTKKDRRDIDRFKDS